MPELDAFEVRLAAAIHAFADRAETRVDAMDTATRAVGHRRFAWIIWFGRRLPLPLAALLVLGLLVALLAWAFAVGGSRDTRMSIVPPTAVPMASTDGVGPESVRGGGTFAIVDSGTATQLGDVTQIRGFVATTVDTTNDPRATGTGTLRLSIDTYGAVGREWGTYRLENDGGAWAGTVTGGAWSGGNASEVAGWLAGSGAYNGLTYYLCVRSTDLTTDIEGIIYSGSPPGQ